MRTIFAEYNPQRNSIDVYTSAGYILRVDCWEAEKNLKTTPGSDCALNALAIDEPLEYARLNPSPARHITTPTILFHVIASLYPTYPSMKRMTSSMDHYLIFQIRILSNFFSKISPAATASSTLR